MTGGDSLGASYLAQLVSQMNEVVKSIKAQEERNAAQENLNRNLLEELNAIRKSTQNASEHHPVQREGQENIQEEDIGDTRQGQADRVSRSVNVQKRPQKNIGGRVGHQQSKGRRVANQSSNSSDGSYPKRHTAIRKIMTMKLNGQAEPSNADR